MKLLLTGATGFIGFNLLLDALKAGHWEKIITPVRDPDRLRRRLVEEGVDVPSGILHIPRGSDTDWGGPYDVTHLIHCAGVLFSRDRDAYMRCNVDGTLRLLRSAPVAERILLLSSQSAGGATPPDAEARHEGHPDQPLTWYGESKKQMELACLAELSHRNIACLRPPMVIGPRDQAIVPLFSMVRGRVRPKPGLHEKYYSWISVTDLVRAILTVLHSPSFPNTQTQRVFYVSAPEPISDRQLILSASRAVGSRGILLPIPQPLMRGISLAVDTLPPLRSRIPNLTRDRAREIWPRRMVVDGSAFSRHFTWQAQDSLDDALLAAWRWLSRTLA